MAKVVCPKCWSDNIDFIATFNEINSHYYERNEERQGWTFESEGMDESDPAESYFLWRECHNQFGKGHLGY
jgi:hypothetical protein